MNARELLLQGLDRALHVAVFEDHMAVAPQSPPEHLQQLLRRRVAPHQLGKLHSSQRGLQCRERPPALALSELMRRNLGFVGSRARF